MTQVVDIPIRSKIREEAAGWVARLDAGSMTTDDLKELKTWLEQSPLHVEELEQVADVWDKLDVLGEYRKIIIAPGKSLSDRFRVPASIAASLVILSLGLLFVSGYFQSGPGTLTAQIHETELGEQKALRLPDGSNIRMNTASRLKVEYEASARTVYLDQGEAFFDVQADSQRPFMVETPKGTITAVGTAFSVRLGKPDMQVTVSEGVVKLFGRKQDETNVTGMSSEWVHEPAMLTAGQSASFDKKLNSIETLEPRKIIQRLAWRDGMLIFEGDTLEAVINEVSRYTPIEIHISDPDLKQLRIGGYFRIGEIDSLLKALEKGFGVRVEHAGIERIFLYPDKS